MPGRAEPPRTPHGRRPSGPLRERIDRVVILRGVGVALALAALALVFTMAYRAFSSAPEREARRIDRAVEGAPAAAPARP